MNRAPAGKERDLFSISVPAIDLLYDLTSLLCFLSLAKNISSPKKQLLLLVLLEHGWAVGPQSSLLPYKSLSNNEIPWFRQAWGFYMGQTRQCLCSSQS